MTGLTGVKVVSMLMCSICDKKLSADMECLWIQKNVFINLLKKRGFGGELI